ncbi:unnamed protein product [Rhizoctonia solani]|uniref:Uncharacterized protein n=1 Tax=Rhizoctonia solani TaxID=456999 RepID=A0A8H2WX47_9AGAM|nr:unnamed protein product [Rhizoctonia solani]CAE6451598.1 unnamed protein product [Rhizoctonia solani]
MSSKSKDSSSVRSLSTSSSRSSLSAWRPDASVRLFAERCHDASPFDDELSLGSETDLTSGRTSPEPLYDLSPIPLTSARYKAQAREAASNIQTSVFTPDMATSALVAAARDAAQAVSAATDYDQYSPVDEPELYIGFGTLPKKGIAFKRPRRACMNRWASTNRRYVDILL